MLLIIITSLLIGLIFAPLGCFILWKRYIYFADSLAHASIIASVINCLIGVSPIYSLIISSFIFTTIVFFMKNQYENNSAIGLTASAMIAISIALSDIFPDKIKIKNLLVGNIISTNMNNVIILSILAIIVFLFLFLQYRNLLLSIISPDIAFSKGVKVKLVELLFLLIMSFSILFTIKMVGVLLIISIITIPPMIAQIITTSPKSMIYNSILFAIIMNVIGAFLYHYTEISFAPSIIIAGVFVFCIVKKYRIFKDFCYKSNNLVIKRKTIK